MITLAKIMTAAILILLLLRMLGKTFRSSNLHVLHITPQWLGMPWLWLMRLSPFQRVILASLLTLRLGWQLQVWTEVLVITLAIFFTTLLARSHPLINNRCIQFPFGIAINLNILVILLRILGLLFSPNDFINESVDFVVRSVLWSIADGSIFFFLYWKKHKHNRMIDTEFG